MTAFNSRGIKRDSFGFPSDMIPPSEKGREFFLAHAKAFNKEFTLGGGKMLRRYALEDYEKNRLYAQGKQPIDQYKQMLTYKRNKGKVDISWRNLDWNILPILPTMVAVVKNKVLGQKKDILIRGIDQMSQNAERERRNQIRAYVDNLKIVRRVQQEFGAEVDSPIVPGAPIPANVQEIDLHMQMYPKDRYIMELYDQIERTMDLNNEKQIWDDVVGDLVEVGVAGTKCYIDIMGVIRVRRVIPERVFTNNCVNPDFSDMTRVCEFIQMSISELRASVPRGTFSEADYAKMATQSSGTTYNIAGIDSHFKTNMCYPYDHEKVLVMDTEFFSADDYAYVVEKSNRGNLNHSKQKNPYWLDNVKWKDENGREKIGVTDEQYVKFNAGRGQQKQIIRDSVKNLYGYKWVVGTEYIFDYGLKENMQRTANRLGDVKSNYNLYTFFDSFMRRAEPLADQIQLNWLQHQHHVAQSKPSGLKINKRALTALSVGGKAGMELDELEVLRMYAESGNIVYKGEDAAGRPYQFDPIQEIKGGINEAAQVHLDFILQHIDLLRTIFGLNQATDSSTPNPKLGKAIAEMLEQNTNTALGTVYHAYSKIYEDTIKSVAMLVPDAEMIQTAAKDEGLGESSGSFFRANYDTTFREMAIKIEDGPTNEIRTTLKKYIETAIANKEIRAEDGYLVENEPNIMRAYYMLAQKRRQKMEEDQKIMQQNYQMEQEKNINSAVAAEKAKADIQMQLINAEVQKEQMLHPLKLEQAALPGLIQIIIKKMELGHTVTEAENQRLDDFYNLLEKNRSAEKIASMKPKPTSKPAPKRKSA
jgi:hypothetical protein